MPIVSDKDKVAKMAYSLWEEAGKPQGRDWEFWFRAETNVANEIIMDALCSPPGTEEHKEVAEKMSSIVWSMFKERQIKRSFSFVDPLPEEEYLKINNKSEYIRADDFFGGSRKTTIAEDVRKQIQEEKKNQVVDPEQLRRGEDYSFLADKIVGAEGPPDPPRPDKKRDFA